MKKEPLSLKIKSELKEMLNLVTQDGRTQTYHLEKALINYFKAKKITKE